MIIYAICNLQVLYPVSVLSQMIYGGLPTMPHLQGVFFTKYGTGPTQ